MRRAELSRPRTAAITMVTGLGLAVTSPPARAQLCHDLPALDSHDRRSDPSSSETTDDAVAISVAVRAEAATAAIDRRPIDYQGTSLRIELQRHALQLRVQATWYRLRDSLDTTGGPGDVMVAAMWTAYRTQELQAGVVVPVGIPTGDMEEHLGMGHWMAMPGVFAAWRPSQGTTATAGVSYNRALGNQEGHDHGTGPYVNPMTEQEMGFAGRVTQGVSPTLQLVGESSLAVPFEDAARMILGAGFSMQRGKLAVTVLAQKGALSAPFTSRGVVELGYAF